MSGSPSPGQPYSAQPASAQPYSGMPYSGAAPITGGPISSLPTSAGLFGVGSVSAGPIEGTVYGLPVTDRAVETASNAGKAIEAVKSAPQIPTPRALELMTSASPPSGLVIGRDAEQVPVVAPFFRPEETRINLIGGVYLARLLVFRALAIGTRVAVCTTRPQEWNGLGETATRPQRPPRGPARRPAGHRRGQPALTGAVRRTTSANAVRRPSRSSAPGAPS